MRTEFAKYEGAGNDFILIDNRGEGFTPDPRLIARLCDRHFGIGADGVMTLSRSAGTDCAMRYFNADGSEGEMCGNGARCFALFAEHLGIGGERKRFTAADGLHTARILRTEGTGGCLRPGPGDPPRHGTVPAGHERQFRPHPARRRDRRPHLRTGRRGRDAGLRHGRDGGGHRHELRLPARRPPLRRRGSRRDAFGTVFAGGRYGTLLGHPPHGARAAGLRRGVRDRKFLKHHFNRFSPMKTQKGVREQHSDELRKARRLEPLRKSGKERHTLYNSLGDEDDEELTPYPRRESALDYLDDDQR